jgi:TatD DNase family protein
MLVDTHAHIHFDLFREELDEVLDRAVEADVQRILCVGVDEVDSGQALAVARAYQHVYATAGLHPHEADRGYEALEEVQRLVELDPDNVVAIGECGLDYYREGFDKDAQDRALRFQIELALEHDLPLVFHVRDAFEDFFRVLDDYEGVRGVVHCFTAGPEEMREAVKRGLYVALNGIMSFTKDKVQLVAARELPLEHLVLETDCPFLTPVPKRGQRNEPANVALTAEFLAELRGESLEELSDATSRNALRLFGIK